MTEIKISTHPRDKYVPMALFGKDHWSTFAYVETRLVDHGGFTIAVDPRMRTLSHNHRIFNHRPSDNPQKKGSANAVIGKRTLNCSHGKRPTECEICGNKEAMFYHGTLDLNSDDVRLGSWLNDGTRLPAHDDWDCIQDLAEAGLLIGDATEHPLRVFDAQSMDDFGKIVAADDYAARIKLAEFIREQVDHGLDIGAKVYFTAEGFRCAAALRKHKATGGHFHYFRWPNPPESSQSEQE